MKRAEKGIGQLNDTTNEILEDIHESTLFSFVFGKKKKHRK